ncbi:MAG TPA: YqgE/AlgH family protein [Polyangia bacterium]|nr:YqgE/AlgH family protein [Polyangia bacterium]
MESVSLAPGLLLAAPALGDPNFTHSVVLLGHHDAGGAFGWVINGRPLVPARQLLEEAELTVPGVTLAGPSFESLTRIGGPVLPGSAWLLFEAPSESSGIFGRVAQSQAGQIELADEPGVHHLGDRYWITGNRDFIEALARGEGPNTFRLFLGYAGWGPQQLETEIQAGAWLPASFDGALLFGHEPDELWDVAYRRAVGAPPAVFTSTTRGSA